jgi:hypothetical protein
MLSRGSLKYDVLTQDLLYMVFKVITENTPFHWSEV